VPYYRFFLKHPRVLSFGVLLTLFSSFGQTFLISIFVPRLLETFSLNTAQFGLLYAAATLTSAASLPFFGRLLDRSLLSTFSLGVGAGLVCACLAMALAPNVPVLFLAIVGLRLTGQGLLSLTASTTMARVFEQGRGKALSVSALGYPLGEGMLPLVIVLLIHAVGWRLSWGILGVTIAMVLLPAMNSLLKSVEPVQKAVVELSSQPSKGLLRDWRFYLLLPGVVFLPLVLTGLFLYQIPLAEFRGWSEQTMATAFIGFAIARMVSSLIAGQLIDRWGAMRLFPVILLPVALGLILLAGGNLRWIAYAYLFLAGISQGMTGPAMTALWAEIYGVESLGRIKSTVATIGIFSTALGPLLLGWLLQAGLSFSTILPVCVAFAFAASFLNFWLSLRLRQNRASSRFLWEQR
jgi:MFS family permease